MNIDFYIVRLAILLIPGIAGYKLYKIARVSGWTGKLINRWEHLLYILLYSIVSYITLYNIQKIISVFTGREFKNLNLYTMIDGTMSIDYNELAFALIISLFIGLLAAVNYNKKWMYKLLNKINITNHYGDEDIWSLVLNDCNVRWVFVRDHKLALVYKGYIQRFSESHEMREIYLTDVDVYDYEKEDSIYSVEAMYICRDDSEISIEPIINQ
jgi:hypothetical protein